MPPGRSARWPGAAPPRPTDVLQHVQVDDGVERLVPPGQVLRQGLAAGGDARGERREGRQVPEHVGGRLHRHDLQVRVGLHQPTGDRTGAGADFQHPPVRCGWNSSSTQLKKRSAVPSCSRSSAAPNRCSSKPSRRGEPCAGRPADLRSRVRRAANETTSRPLTPHRRGGRAVDDRALPHLVPARDHMAMNAICRACVGGQGVQVELADHLGPGDPEAGGHVGDPADAGDHAEGEVGDAAERPPPQGQAGRAAAPGPAGADDHVQVLRQQPVDQVRQLGRVVLPGGVQGHDQVGAPLSTTRRNPAR